MSSTHELQFGCGIWDTSVWRRICFVGGVGSRVDAGVVADVSEDEAAENVAD